MNTMPPPPVTVAIGASAGGVEALRSFFGATEPGCGLAFIVNLHFPAQATSHLVGILSNCTALPVTTAVHGEAIQADHVYIVPPGVVVTLEVGCISLADADDTHNPIDHLFCALADELGERAVGVVLSGTGSDGTLGIKAISAGGGLTVAQAQGKDGAMHPEMPASAIATGLVDQVLQVEEMPAQLVAYGKIVLAGSAARAAPHHLKKVKEDLCELLLTAARHDFSRYKASTFLRRVERRMRVLEIADWAGYVEYARRNPDEVLRLFRDLLIGVTAFFRDGGGFQALATDIIPRLFEGKGPHDKVRVWVPGCSSGEEAYSIAILLYEYANAHANPPQLEVFATDVDEEALRTARSGRYSARAAIDGLGEKRAGRFFARDGDTLIADRSLRAICTFASHSVIRDPPLCSMDLVSCRNVLIYFDRALQDQVIPTFHFALRPGGFLFLGPSEGVGHHGELFTPLDKTNRIFQRLAISRRALPFLPPSRSGAAPHTGVSRKAKPAEDRTVAQAAAAQIQKLYGPANVVVNEGGDIVHFSARTGSYLEAIAGGPNHNLVAMARKELRINLRGALHEAKETGRVAVRDSVSVALAAGVTQNVRVAVEPLEYDGGDALWLVTFLDSGHVSIGDEPGPEDANAVAEDMAVQHLERELQETRQNLRTAIDEYEISVEELRSSNEELMSMNDDLQASNEELEASKEELHVVNDEMSSVNGELAAKIDELKQANGDLRNLFDSTKIAVVFLGQDLAIRSFTPAATEIFRLVPGDVGRSLADISSFLDYATLNADIAAAMGTSQAVERAVSRGDTQAHYLLRIIPYRTLDGEMDGVLVTLTNVTAAVEALAQQRHQGLLIAELNHRVKNILAVAASLAAQSLRGTATAEDFATVFLGRLQALATAQDLLSRGQWEDVPLKALITTAVALQSDDAGRLSLDGPPIRIWAKAANTLSLAFHELTTNAIKYGALANETGHIAITWAKDVQADGEFLVIRWRESGGPSVQPPARKGFGSELIERGIRYELSGTATVAYRPEGVDVRLSIPLSAGQCPPDSVATDKGASDAKSG
jgi:two-component system CheB/CheR fusion protein